MDLEQFMKELGLNKLDMDSILIDDDQAHHHPKSSSSSSSSSSDNDNDDEEGEEEEMKKQENVDIQHHTLVNMLYFLCFFMLSFI